MLITVLNLKDKPNSPSYLVRVLYKNVPFYYYACRIDFNKSPLYIRINSEDHFLAPIECVTNKIYLSEQALCLIIYKAIVIGHIQEGIDYSIKDLIEALETSNDPEPQENYDNLFSFVSSSLDIKLNDHIDSMSEYINKVNKNYGKCFSTNSD